MKNCDFLDYFLDEDSDYLDEEVRSGSESAICEKAVMLTMLAEDFPERLKEARKIWQLGVDAGYASCMTGLAANYQYEDAQGYYTKIKSLYCKAMELGDQLAGAQLGIFLSSYGKTGAELVEGEELVQKAANAGIAEAIDFMISEAEYDQDDKAVFHWLRKLESCPDVDPGDYGVYGRLGRCYLEGRGTAVNESKACSCFKKGYKTEDEYAAYGLALCYLEGRGTKKNRTRGVQIMLEAAALDCEEAKAYILNMSKNPDTPESELSMIRNAALASFATASDVALVDSCRKLFLSENNTPAPELKEFLYDTFEERELEIPEDLREYFQ